MGKLFTGRLQVSIDVGTTKICVLVAQQLDQDRVEILGVGKAPSHGLHKGVVVDVAKTIHSIKSAVAEAEIMAGVKIEQALLGIAGAHISSRNCHGAVPIKTGEIREYDIKAVLAAARAFPIPEGQQILHVLPQYFSIDGQEPLQDPRGMHGIRLEVNAHIIMGSITSVQNLIKCCQKAGVKVQDIILEQLASADAVLCADEQKLGVGVLDIGGGTADLAIFQHGSIRHTKVFAIAGNHFTNDLAVGLRTSQDEAERLKRTYGFSYFEPNKTNQMIEVKLVHGYQKEMVHIDEIAFILKARAQELLKFIKLEIEQHHLQLFMRAGLVLTGGGSLLLGMKDLAQSMLKMPVRIGRPRIEFGLPESLDNPIYATSYGLIIHTLKKEKNNALKNHGPLASRVFSRMKSWVAEFF